MPGLESCCVLFVAAVPSPLASALLLLLRVHLQSLQMFCCQSFKVWKPYYCATTFLQNWSCTCLFKFILPTGSLPLYSIFMLSSPRSTSSAISIAIVQTSPVPCVKFW